MLTCRAPNFRTPEVWFKNKGDDIKIVEKPQKGRPDVVAFLHQKKAFKQLSQVHKTICSRILNSRTLWL